MQKKAYRKSLRDLNQSQGESANEREIERERASEKQEAW